MRGSPGLSSPRAEQKVSGGLESVTRIDSVPQILEGGIPMRPEVKLQNAASWAMLSGAEGAGAESGDKAEGAAGPGRLANTTLWSEFQGIAAREQEQKERSLELKALEEKEKKEREAAVKLLQAERVEREKVAQTEAREARRRAEVEEENRLREEYIAEQKRLLDEMEAEAEAQGVRDLASTRVGGSDPYGQQRARVLLSLGLKIKGVAMPPDGGQKSTQMAGQEDGEI